MKGFNISQFQTVMNLRRLTLILAIAMVAGFALNATPIHAAENCDVRVINPCTVTLDPPDDINPVGTDHTVTVVVMNEGQLSPNKTLDSIGILSGSINEGVIGTCSNVDTNGNCATDGAGEVSFTYTSNGLPGTDTIEACATFDGLDVPFIGDTQVCGEAQKEWVLAGNPSIGIEKYTLVVPSQIGGDLCDTFGKPQLLTMMYTGDMNQTSNSQDSSKVTVTGVTNDTSPVNILASDKGTPTDSKAKVYFSGIVNLNDSFDINSLNVGDNELRSNTYVHVLDGSILLQTVNFHTSCSQPLVLGDQFGSAKLISLTDKDGNGASLPSGSPGLGEDADTTTGPSANVGDAIVWSYVATNTGDVPLVDVTVTDDQGVAVSCPQTTLAVGESMTCTANGIAVAGQYANVGTATGDHNGTTVMDTDPSHYIVIAPPINVCDGGKPQVLTMAYVGGSVISNSQEGKAKIEFDAPLGSEEPVRIIANDKSNPFDNKAKVWFDSLTANINLNDTFDIDATNAGATKLKSATRVHILDGNNVLLQTVNFHTSCSKVLNLDDVFGGVQLKGFIAK